MVTTSGSTLLPESATTAYLTHLLPYTTLLTPNIPEALLLSKLAGHPFPQLPFSKRHELANFLASRTKKWVLLKGGHDPIEQNGRKVVVDILVNSSKGVSREFISEFSTSKNTHGTGCTLACSNRVW